MEAVALNSYRLHIEIGGEMMMMMIMMVMVGSVHRTGRSDDEIYFYRCCLFKMSLYGILTEQAFIKISFKFYV